MYKIGSYQYVFRPCHPSAELRSLDSWSKCTADVQSARYGPDGISREYRRERSKIPLSRRYLRNVAQCTVERPSKRPSSYMPKLYTDHLNSYIRKKHAETSADGCRLCQVQLLSATAAHRCFLRGSFRAPTEGGEASTGLLPALLCLSPPPIMKWGRRQTGTTECRWSLRWLVSVAPPCRGWCRGTARGEPGSGGHDPHRHTGLVSRRGTVIAPTLGLGPCGACNPA